MTGTTAISGEWEEVGGSEVGRAWVEKMTVRL